jgi:hypothetical protein
VRQCALTAYQGRLLEVRKAVTIDDKNVPGKRSKSIPGGHLFHMLNEIVTRQVKALRECNVFLSITL